MQRIGIALGGGGVRGLAHVLALRVLDDLGVRPALIAGTSIGAIIGAAYAAGIPARELHDLCLRHTLKRGDGLLEVIGKRAELRRWLDAFSVERGRGGLLSPDGMFGYLFAGLPVRRFEQLRIPLRVIATDYWAATEVVFRSGDLEPALRASMAFPGVFAPAEIDGRVLVDGGVVNNVPYDHLQQECDLVIAVDVAKTREPERETVPGIIDAITGAYDIMHDAELGRRMRHSPPDIYVRPQIQGIRVFDFTSVEEVFRQAAPAMRRLRGELERRLRAAG
ncbi:MAG TPA: patatin-like phospholipase family protein [Gammaproteobacteria bacterium]